MKSSLATPLAAARAVGTLLVACATLAGCATLDWQKAGQNALGGVCRSAGNCTWSCDDPGQERTAGGRCHAAP